MPWVGVAKLPEPGKIEETFAGSFGRWSHGLQCLLAVEKEASKKETRQARAEKRAAVAGLQRSTVQGLIWFLDLDMGSVPHFVARSNGRKLETHEAMDRDVSTA